MDDVLSRRPLNEPDYPLPTLLPGKTPPRARYTTRCFLEDHHDEIHHADGVKDSATTTSNSQYPCIDAHLVSPRILANDEAQSSSRDSGENNNDSEILGVDGENAVLHESERHQPAAGQHLLLDISNVDPAFLRNMSALAHSLVAITTQAQLTILSYHCHDLKPPMGVSCLGVLPLSHISIQTWPSGGILSMDLFTCGSGSLLSLLPTIQELFALKTSSASDGASSPPPPPTMRWLHKKRGFRYFEDAAAAAAQEENPTQRKPKEVLPGEVGQHSARTESHLLGWRGYSEKNLLANVQSKYQNVQVYQTSRTETINEQTGDIPSKEDQSSNLMHGHNPRSRSVRRIFPDRVRDRANSNKLLFLDGVISASLRNLEAYHEALVHMAMLAHPDPKRVAIIGGGEGATLREVLKFKSVEECTMVEIDDELIHLAQATLPEWNDCSDLILRLDDKEEILHENGYESCFSNPRSKLVLSDAVKWFVDNFGPSATTNDVEKFDIIIMNPL